MSTAVQQTVLIVDDEPAIVETLIMILQSKGLKAFGALSAEEALSKLQIHKPDLLLIDVVMPGMNGIELAIKVSERLPSGRILLFSGNAFTGDLLADARDRGYEFELLAKPVHPEELFQAIGLTNAQFLRTLTLG